MFVAPGTVPDFAHKLSRDAAERVSRNWSLLLLNGLLLIVAGVLIFSINWSIRSLATFIGALFILEGLVMALTTGIDQRVRRANVLTGMLSIAAGVAIIVWPGPGILAVAIFLGAWLILARSPSFSPRLVAAADPRPARSAARRTGSGRPGRNPGRDHHRQRHLGGRRRRHAGHPVLRGQEPPEAGRRSVQRTPRNGASGHSQAPSGQPHSQRNLIWPGTSVRIDGGPNFVARSGHIVRVADAIVRLRGDAGRDRGGVRGVPAIQIILRDWWTHPEHGAKAAQP
jgi:hypothetical protein